MERESKFCLPYYDRELVKNVLDRVLRVDPVYPNAQVYSLYFDTPSKKYLSEKENSDYLKTKFRLRWYKTKDRWSEQVFGEIKRRIGYCREKERFILSLTPSEILGMDFSSVKFIKIGDEFKKRDPSARSHLVPSALIRYERFRYIDQVTENRYSLDSDITILKINPQVVATPARPLKFPIVFEMKSKGDVLPRHLSWLMQLGAKREAFSKYQWGMATTFYDHSNL